MYIEEIKYNDPGTPRDDMNRSKHFDDVEDKLKQMTGEPEHQKKVSLATLKRQQKKQMVGSDTDSKKNFRGLFKTQDGQSERNVKKNSLVSESKEYGVMVAEMAVRQPKPPVVESRSP